MLFNYIYVFLFTFVVFKYASIFAIFFLLALSEKRIIFDITCLKIVQFTPHHLYVFFSFALSSSILGAEYVYAHYL